MTRPKIEVDPRQGERLTKVIKSLGLSQKKAANIMSPSGQGSQTTVWRLANGKAQLNYQDAIKLLEYAKAKGQIFRLEWLLCIDDYATPKEYEKHMRKSEALTDDDSRKLHTALQILSSEAGLTLFEFYSGKISESFTVDQFQAMKELDGDEVSFHVNDGLKDYHLTNDEIRKIESELVDYCGYLLTKTIKTKGGNNGKI